MKPNRAVDAALLGIGYRHDRRAFDVPGRQAAVAVSTPELAGKLPGTSGLERLVGAAVGTPAAHAGDPRGRAEPPDEDDDPGDDGRGYQNEVRHRDENGHQTKRPGRRQSGEGSPEPVVPIQRHDDGCTCGPLFAVSAEGELFGPPIHSKGVPDAVSRPLTCGAGAASGTTGAAAADDGSLFPTR